jgi:hypothetical protein
MTIMQSTRHSKSVIGLSPAVSGGGRGLFRAGRRPGRGDLFDRFAGAGVDHDRASRSPADNFEIRTVEKELGCPQDGCFYGDHRASHNSVGQPPVSLGPQRLNRGAFPAQLPQAAQVFSGGGPGA